MAEVDDVELAPIGAVRRTRIGRQATEPMREDIRLLGAILGDTIREQNGDEVFDLVERARVESFRVRRSEIDRADLARIFVGIDIQLAIPVVRAFTLFALLAISPRTSTASGVAPSMCRPGSRRGTAAWPPPIESWTPRSWIPRRWPRR